MIPLPATILTLARRFNITAVSIAVLCVLLAVQTVRLEGMKLWPIKVEGWIAKAERYKAERDRIIEAQAEARAAQIAVNQAEQDRLDALAERIDANAAQTRIAVADATADFIARNRVRQDRQCVASGTDSPATGDSAGEPSPVPADAIMVEASDVRACSEWVAYGLSAREWALGVAEKP